MSTKNLLEQIKNLPPEEQGFLVNNLLDHMFLEDENEDDHFHIYNLDIF